MSDQESHEPESEVDDEAQGTDGNEEGGEVDGRHGVKDLIGLLGERLQDGKSDGIEQGAAALAAEVRRGSALTQGEVRQIGELLASPMANAIPTSLWLDLDRARRAR